MIISAFSIVEDILCKIASSMTEDLWQSVIVVSAFRPFGFAVLQQGC
jgi:hypothetical protein